MMDEKTLEMFCTYLTTTTGIIPLASHKQGISSFIDRRINELSAGNSGIPLSYSSYYNLMMREPQELDMFINASTVNETYFFREESQFTLLKNDILPYWKIMNPGKKLRIWSAASSSGEEAYSLALLALSCGITPQVIATDIDTGVLDKCKKGIYQKQSVRTHDGSAYHTLLQPYRNSDDEIEFPQEIKNLVTTQKLNLKDLNKSPFAPIGQDIIFIRNVFIYFSREFKQGILNILTQKCLNPSGYLFVSMNEIATIDSTLMPANLSKECGGKVFYFKKQEG